MKNYNWAILGCGRIAGKFVSDLKLLPNAVLYAAAARNKDRAEAFANEHGFARSYGSYEEMVADPNVDVVYIATPHSHHYEHSLLCLKNKKAVLCEKAFGMNAREVKEMIDTAKENNTFLMEAFWTRFQPSFQKAMDIVKSGELGELKIVRSDFAFNADFNPDKRLYNVELGGGSLLDIGIYPVFASLMALGKPSAIKTMANFSPTGSEESILMSFNYDGGKMATLMSSFACHSSVETEYLCTEGTLKLNRRWHEQTSISIWRKATNEEEVIEAGLKEGFGYQFEAEHVMKCLEEGKIESDLMSHSLSLQLMEILDWVRKDANIVFPNHD